jgi:MYXO-CTERM domain-containing protein
MKHLALVTLVAVGSPAFAQSVWTAPSTLKIRPSDAAGSATSANLEAAGNEFEAFHVVVDGGAGGAKAVTVSADVLTGPSGATIGDVRVYREAWYNATQASYQSSPTGRWPDAMIPAVDEIANETRNAFPYDVPAHEQQPIFVEYHVPANAAPGWYSGTVHVTGGASAEVPVKLYVHAFSLPSTASIRTAFGIGYNDACIAHFGSLAACGGEAGSQALLSAYTRLALDHRISLTDVASVPPVAKADGTYDWGAWDATYGPMLDGQMGGRLSGARLTSMRYTWTPDQAHFAEWAKHFRAKGWFDRTFDYTCDEPPAGCSWGDIPARAALVHAADPAFQTLVTTPMTKAQANDLLGSVDILVPTDNGLDPMPPDANNRASYDAWLAEAPQHDVWIYQSCDSDGCNGPGGATQSTWPGYMIDGPAVQNRAFEWQAWKQKVQGELYYDTTYAFTHGDAWNTQYYFGGNGDGTLFYPGTPARIGGTTPIPIASLRLKMAREGQEDYEYFKALADAGDAAMADAEANALSPSAYNLVADAGAIDAARHRMAVRIEALTGKSPPPMNEAPVTDAPGTGGNGATSGDAPGATPSAGGGSQGGCSFAAGGAPSGAAFGLVALAALALARRRRQARALVHRSRAR